MKLGSILYVLEADEGLLLPRSQDVPHKFFTNSWQKFEGMHARRYPRSTVEESDESSFLLLHDFLEDVRQLGLRNSR